MPVPEPIAEPSGKRLRSYFDESRTLCTDARLKAREARRYYDGNQLSQPQKAALRRRKQPEMPINYVRAAVNGIVGVVIQNPTDPRAYARTPDKEDAADVASKVLRYSADVNHFDQTKADKLEEGCVEGDYAVIVEGAPDEDPSITDIRWEEFFYDPHSRRSDFADAKYLGIGKWMYADHIASIYPDNQTAVQALRAFSANGTLDGWGDETWLDRPDDALPWYDTARKRLMVVEVYYLEAGDWYRAVYTAGGILEHGKSAYVDDRGKTACPIIAASAYVDGENRRYGVVSDMMPIQDGINMRESKLMHLLNSRQVQMTDGNAQPIDADLARKEAARPDGVLPMGWSIVPTDAQVAGQAQLLGDAKQEILRMSPNPSIVGRGAEDASGRAVQLRQQAGLIELARVLGRFTDWELRVYKAVWSRCRQFWTAPKWIRVSDDEGTPQYVLINDDGGQPQPGQLYDQQQMQATQAPQQPPQAPHLTAGAQMGIQPDEPDQPGAPDEPDAPAVAAVGPQPAPQMGPAVPGSEKATAPPVVAAQAPSQPIAVPQAMQQPQPKNHIASMDVDIVVDTVPHNADLQHEMRQALMKLLGSNPQWMAQVPFSVALKALYDGPDKKSVVEMIQGVEQQAQQQQAKQQLAQMQVHEQDHNADMAERQAKVENTRADTQVKLATVPQTVAETRRTDIQGTAEAAQAHIAIEKAPVELAQQHIANQVAADPGVAGVANPA